MEIALLASSFKIKGMTITQDIIDRFNDKVVMVKSGCWEWQGAISGTTGYGNFGIKYPINISSHRFSYYINLGEIDGKTIMHKCDNRKCVNPNHLVAGNHCDNMKDMVLKRRSGRLGEKSPNTSLKNDDILKIRKLRDEGLLYREIGDKYGITRQQASLICRRLNWKHV